MKLTNVVSKLPWAFSNGKMDLKKMNVIVVHHDAVDRPVFYNTLKRLKNEALVHIKNKWGHLSYHYSIDNAGEIFECVPLDEVCYHCGNLVINKKSIAIKLDGNFMTQKPTDKQVKALEELITYLTTKRPDMPLIIKSSIKMHKEIKATACPGINLYATVERIRR